MRGPISFGFYRTLVILASALSFSCATPHKAKSKSLSKQNTTPKVNSLSPMLPDGTEEDVWQSIVREADSNPVKDIVEEHGRDEYCNEFAANGRDDLAWDLAFGDHDLQVAMAKENERLEAASIQATRHGATEASDTPASNYCIPPITPDKFADGIGE